MKSLVLSARYARYFFSSQTKHDIHSPFVFNLVTRVINKREKKPVFAIIENIRKKLLRDHSTIGIRDFGAGFGGQKFVEKSISFITGNSSKSKKYSMLLHRLVEYFSPATLLELGTSVGISAMYQASAAPEGHLTTMEGCENTASVAAWNFKQAGFKNIRLVIGDFEKTLPVFIAESSLLDFVFIDGNHRREPVLHYFNSCVQKAHPGSCFIIDDINWSEEMREAWEIIRSNPKVYITVDLFMMGLVFFNPDHSKQNFTIRF